MRIRLGDAILFYLLASMYLSCSKDKGKNGTGLEAYAEGSESDRVTLVADRIVTLPIDDRTSLQNPTIQYLTYKDRELISVSDRVTNRLLVFDWQARRPLFQVKFASQGENGIGDFDGATILSMDSIVVLGSAKNTIYLSDTTGRIYDRFEMLSRKIDEPLQWLGYSITSHFKVRKKEIYAFTLPPGFGQEGEASAFDAPFIVHYELDDRSWDYLPVTFSASNMLTHSHYAFTHFLGDLEWVDDKIVVNFPASDKLVVFEDGELKSFPASVKGSPKIEPLSEIATSTNDVHRDILETPTYFFLIYDPYKKNYYRFFLDKTEDLSSIGDILKIYDQKPATVVILDSAMNKIGQTSLPMKTYHMPDHFVTPEGLYLSTNNPDNPNINDDFLSYQLLKLELKIVK